MKKRLHSRYQCSSFMCFFDRGTAAIQLKVRNADGFGFTTKWLCLHHAEQVLRGLHDSVGEGSRELGAHDEREHSGSGVRTPD